MFDQRAQDRVWNKDANALIASSFIFPAGRARKVDGGYALRGSWPFSSGVDSCEWNMLASVVSSDDEADGIEYRIFLLPRRDYTIPDTWNATGLRGTGSNDVEVNDAFVAEAMTVAVSDLAGGPTPGSAVNPNRAVCAAGVLAVSLCAVRRGARQRAGLPRRLCRCRAASRLDLQPRQAQRPPEHPDQDRGGLRQDRCGPPDHALDLHRGDGRRAGAATFPISPPRPGCGATAPIRSISAPKRCRCCLRRAARAACSRSGALQRQFRDAHAINSHLAFNFDAAGTNYGRVALGLPSENLTL